MYKNYILFNIIFKIENGITIIIMKQNINLKNISRNLKIEGIKRQPQSMNITEQLIFLPLALKSNLRPGRGGYGVEWVNGKKKTKHKNKEGIEILSTIKVNVKKLNKKVF